ncbi:Citrate synthase 2 [Janthinobacterium sp. KBS0711]|uniref:citrate synthase family protein n=1 Tax=Janthinobacterium sp. KBS0711 TaxID=1649647 RepID=UPI0006277D78|nr:citrate synthase family protein [Janthinobacterium sp. KBS0711]KKO62226.1 Citrate synthase 2 [Janthinobacterium sp. KBS0711]TSD72206.1 helix-turn-helix domain-containing protein [Janthinobacterium sp. KBS0711]
MKNDLSALDAARLLGVSLPTLYSYVSRGLLASVSNGDSRRKRYPQEDVLRLAARKNDAKRGGQTAVAAMYWGLPVLETQISHILDGRLLYRGCDATALAQHATLEAAASLLWDDCTGDYFQQDAPALPQGLASVPDTPPLARAMLAMAMLSSLPAPADMLQSGPALMRLLAAALLQTAPSALPLHRQMAQAWQADAEQTQLLRAALVLLADHELNASTFAVRCVASTGASLPAALGAGLAALSGDRHGGGSAAARRMLTQALAAPDARDAIGAFYKTIAPEFAGFGHPLYPRGDPRAAYLLDRLAALSHAHPQVATILSVCATAGELLGARPNADLALAAMEQAFGWPAGAALSVFALARSAGWIAHANEQAASAALIRPRARYIGRHQSD